MQEKFLPIGTVCLLKGGKKKVMITGYLPIPNEQKDVMYDYSACIFPEGILSSEQTAVFNHDQIQEICYMGFNNDEFLNFNNKITEALKKNTKLPSLTKTDNNSTATQGSDGVIQAPTITPVANENKIDVLDVNIDE